MKLSSKEKILLATLGGLLIGGAYYQFVFAGQMEKLNATQQTKNELEAQYNEVMDSLALLESRQQEVKDLLSEINFKTKKFYPSIMQEKIILELDQYLKESSMDGDISFSEISVQSVEKFEATSDDMKESTFQGLVDEYKGTEDSNTEASTDSTESTDNQTTESTENSESNENTDETTSENQTETIESDGTEQSESTVEMLKVTLNYKGNYESLKKFISQIEVSNRQLLITDLSTSVGDDGQLSGTMNLEYYSIPKLSSRDAEYLEWDAEGDYGKEVPFLIQKAQEVEENIESTQATSDFAVIVKSINSDLPSVMIGKSTDTSQSTYITNKENNVQEATIEFTVADGKYYCKYKLGSDKLSEGYDTNGMSFTPSGENIIVDISSEKRDGTDDKSGLNLKVVNKTDKIVEVRITNDDSDARVAVTGNSQNIKVTRK